MKPQKLVLLPFSAFSSALMKVLFFLVFAIPYCSILCQAFCPPKRATSSLAIRHHQQQQRQQSSSTTTTPLFPTTTTNRPTTTTTSSTSLYLNIPSPEVIIGISIALVGFAGWLYIDGADDRERAAQRQEQEAILRKYQEERARQAYIAPQEFWTEEELAPYNGVADEDGPILLAADGLVFNVYKGRNFYGPGGEYHLFAGRDATRFLAKTITEEETPEELGKPLNMGERAALAGWMFTLKSKYDIVGKLEGFDPTTTSMKEGILPSSSNNNNNDPPKWDDPRLS